MLSPVPDMLYVKINGRDVSEWKRGIISSFEPGGHMCIETNGRRGMNRKLERKAPEIGYIPEEIVKLFTFEPGDNSMPTKKNLRNQNILARQTQALRSELYSILSASFFLLIN